MKIVHGWGFPDEDEHMAAQISPDGRYQADHFLAALNYVREFKLAIDGGAHVGTWSRLMADNFEHVISFEPSVDTFACLERNMAHFSCANVSIRQCALGSTFGRVRMTLDGFERGQQQKNTGARFCREGNEADRITLDSLNLQDVGFLKLDIEGGEPDALLGAQETLRRCRPVVLFENKNFWKRYGHAEDAPQRILSRLGAKPLEKVGRDEIWGW